MCVFFISLCQIRKKNKKNWYSFLGIYRWRHQRSATSPSLPWMCSELLFLLFSLYKEAISRVAALLSTLYFYVLFSFFSSVDHSLTFVDKHRFLLPAACAIFLKFGNSVLQVSFFQTFFYLFFFTLIVFLFVCLFFSRVSQQRNVWLANLHFRLEVYRFDLLSFSFLFLKWDKGPSTTRFNDTLAAGERDFDARFSLHSFFFFFCSTLHILLHCICFRYSMF